MKVSSETLLSTVLGDLRKSSQMKSYCMAFVVKRCLRHCSAVMTRTTVMTEAALIKERKPLIEGLFIV